MSQSPTGKSDIDSAEQGEQVYYRNLVRLNRMLRQGTSWSGSERNCCFLNTGTGRFANVSGVSGFDFPDDARALGLVDWDQDGDLDVWVTNRTGPRVRFLRNESERVNHFLSLALRGTKCNRDAIGTRVEVLTNESPARRLVHTLRAGEGFLGQSSKRLHFGLGSSRGIKQIAVRWPDGSEQRFANDGKDIVADRCYLLVQGRDELQPLPHRRPKLPELTALTAKNSPLRRLVLTSPAPLPTFRYQSLAGKWQSLDDRADIPLFVTLWSSRCAPCLQELDEISKAATRLRDAGLNVLALCVDGLSDDASASAKTIAALNFPFDVGHADLELVDKLQILHNELVDVDRPLAVPLSLLLDKRGKLAVFYKGRLSVEQLLADVALLASDARTRLRASLPFPGRWSAEPAPFRPLLIAAGLLDRDYLEDGIRYVEANRARIEPDPDFAPLLARIGRLLRENGAAPRAIGYFREALEMDPDLTIDRVNLAIMCAEQNELTLAQSLLRDEIARHPENALAHLNLGATLAQQGEFGKAVTAYEQAVRLSPANALARLNLGVALQQLGQLTKAEASLRKAIEIDNQAAEAHWRLGQILKGDGRFAEALTHSRAAVELRPAAVPDRYQLALLLQSSGAAREAKSQYRELLRFDPDHVGALNNLAWLLSTHPDSAVRDGPEAVTWARRAVEKSNRQHPSILATLAAAHAEVGDFDKAVGIAAESLALAVEQRRDQLASEMEKRLTRYRNGQPFRMEVLPSSQ